MSLQLVIALRERLATSERVQQAIDGVYSNSPLVVAERTADDPEVRVGWPEVNKIHGKIFLFPGGEETLQEIPRSEAEIGVACYGEQLIDVMRCIEAIQREINDAGKTCPSPAGPPTIKIGRMFFTGKGSPIRETDEDRLWRADGTIRLVWFTQPGT